MERSYLVTLLLVVSDRTTKQELHSELVAFKFEDSERAYYRGVDTTAYYDHENMAYWVRSNTESMLRDAWKSKIFRTNNQRKKLTDLQKSICANKNWCIDAVVVDTKRGTRDEINLHHWNLKKDPANVFWQGEFV